jgi:hypothetical protein
MTSKMTTSPVPLSVRPPPASPTTAPPMTMRLPLPPMPRLSITSLATIQKCKSLQLRPTDVFICSYPKSGTTWTQQIVVSLILANNRRGGCQPQNDDEGDAGKKQYQQQQLQEEDGGNAKSITTSSGRSNISYNHISDLAPFYEIDAHWEPSNNSLAKSVIQNHDKLQRRIFNTHLRWEMLPKEAEQNDTADASLSSSCFETTVMGRNNHLQDLRPSCGKFIYLTRNLPDVCASFYHHLSNQKEGTYTGTFANFVHDWMDGTTIPFGSPLHHLLSFAEGFCDNRYYSASSEGVAEESPDDGLAAKQCSSNHNQSKDDDLCPHNQHQPLLLLSYENMKTNLRQEVLKIIDFLQLSNISMDVLDKELLPTFGFQHMKANSHLFQPKSVTWLNDFQFLRKGEIGDGTKMLMMETTTTTADSVSTTTTTTTASATNATTERCANDEEEEADVTKVPLMVIFRDWVNREEYCREISELESSRGLTREAAEQFRAVVTECVDVKKM